MVIQKTVFVDATEDITPSDMVTNLQIPWCEIPLDLPTQRRNGDAAGNID